MTSTHKRRIWVGGAGIGIEVIFIAAAALGAPRPVWALALLLGCALVLYAFTIGEPSVSDERQEHLQVADGGQGDGDLRGNVFGDNATITVSPPSASNERSNEKPLITVSPADLLNVFQNHTEVQAEKLAETYIGGWIGVKGLVFNVTFRKHSGKYRVILDIGILPRQVGLDFPKNLEEHLPRLRRGDELHVLGRIDGISSFTLSLTDCEFVD